MIPNKIATYTHYKSGVVLYEEEFIDSSLIWVRHPKIGQIYLNTLYGGQPTQKWLKDNPRPK